MSKPIYLFVCSSSEFAKSHNISNLQYAGRVLNLARNGLSDADVGSFAGDFIIVNACKEEEMKFLRLVNLENCLKICVLRKSESFKSEWVIQQSINYDYIIKENQLDVLKDAKTKDEVYNYIKYMDMSRKRPHSDFQFIWNKIKNIIPFLSVLFNKYSH